MMTPSSAGLEQVLSRIKEFERACQFGSAIRLCQQGLKEFPSSYELCNQLGRYLLLQGRLSESVQVFRRLLRAHPDDYMLSSNLLFYRHYSSEESGEEIYSAHLEWCKTWTAAVSRQSFAGAPPLKFEERIRVGFVSPDLRRHPVASFLEPLLKHIDRKRFSVTCYARSVREDEVTVRLKGMCEGWHSFDEQEMGATAREIRVRGTDILFDLAGHTPGQSLMLFAAKPARVQCTYLGYPNTTGLGGMDFRLVDGRSDPEGLADRWNSEKLVRLPESAWCYQPSSGASCLEWDPPVLRNNSITFGSFNSLCKISDLTLELWKQILDRCPASRLLVKNYALQDLEGREIFLKRALAKGLPVERIELLGMLPEHLHYRSYRMVDIMLDTFPYHGTTTTCEALWMGVPVIVLAGNFHVSRVGVTLLHQVQCDDLVTFDAREYVERACDLGSNLIRLKELHHTLRDRMSVSPLVDAPGFARNFEAAILKMVSD